jgi:hypothetical protein
LKAENAKIIICLSHSYHYAAPLVHILASTKDVLPFCLGFSQSQRTSTDTSDAMWRYHLHCQEVIERNESRRKKLVDRKTRVQPGNWPLVSMIDCWMIRQAKGLCCKNYRENTMG